jgi:uncharacterized protein (TIGR03435 family)
MSLGNHLKWPSSAKSITTQGVSLAMVQITQPFPNTLSLAPRTQSAVDWIPIAVLGVWACGFAVLVLIRFRGWLSIRAAVRSSTPIDIPAIVEVRSCPGLLEPGVVGLWRPILLLPVDILKSLTPSQIEAVLAHELCHVRRRDNLFAAFHMIAEAIFWFHPLIWWIGGRLVEERERACDEEVLRLGGEPQVYAEAILNVCKHYLESPIVCVSGIASSDLKKRIHNILAQHIGQNLTLARKLLLAALGIAVIAGPVVLGLVNAPQIRAQSTQTTGAPLPSFEVASIKPNHSPQPMNRVEAPKGRFIATGITAKALIAEAYAGMSIPLRDDQILGGPSWISSERYDIDAKLDDSQVEPLEKLPTGQHLLQTRLRVQSLLADRFKLVVRDETKEVPVYALVIAKNGPKFQEAKPGDTYPNGLKGPDGRSHPGLMSMAGGHLTGQAIPMATLAGLLSLPLGRTVLDRTGLKGDYDFTLQWTPHQRPAGMPMGPEGGKPGTDNPPPPDSSGPSIFTAIQEQLGLKLESTKGPVEVIVIEHIERPSAN